VEQVGSRWFRETNICSTALTLKVVLAAAVFVNWGDSNRGSAFHRYIAKRAKNRTKFLADAARIPEIFGTTEGANGTPIDYFLNERT
jgi:hypothetical protein